MDRHEGSLGALTIAYFKGVYLAIIMERHEASHSVIIALLRGLYLAIIMNRYQGSDSALNID
jgi:hypothetical protein